jgi:hypothetical protein
MMILVGGMTIGLTRAAHECQAFFLMGAFLTGICFSTCHEVHHVWEHQIKRIQYVETLAIYLPKLLTSTMSAPMTISIVP